MIDGISKVWSPGEMAGYNTNSGFHRDESNILWLNKNIKSRKDFAKIVMETINKIKSLKS